MGNNLYITLEQNLRGVHPENNSWGSHVEKRKKKEQVLLVTKKIIHLTRK